MCWHKHISDTGRNLEDYEWELQREFLASVFQLASTKIYI